jgi:hypothetical protein
MEETREQFLSRRPVARVALVIAGPLAAVLYWFWFRRDALEGRLWQSTLAISAFFAVLAIGFLVNLFRAPELLHKRIYSDYEAVKGTLEALEATQPDIEILLDQSSERGIYSVSVRNNGPVTVLVGLQISQIEALLGEEDDYLRDIQRIYRDAALPLLGDRSQSKEYLNPGQRAAFAIALLDRNTGRPFICQVSGERPKKHLSFNCSERLFDGFHLQDGEYLFGLLAHAVNMVPVPARFRLSVKQGDIVIHPI